MQYLISRRMQFDTCMRAYTSEARGAFFGRSHRDANHIVNILGRRHIMKFYPAQSFSVRQPFSSPFRHHALFGRTQCECRLGDWQTAYILLDSAGWVCSPERHQPHPKSLIPPSCNCPATHARLQECAAMRRSSRRRCPSPSVSQQVGRLRHTGHLCANSHSAKSEEWRMVQWTPAGGAAARLGALWQTRRDRGGQGEVQC